jgi:DNA-binding IclR family transcriptional regulator
MKTNELHKEIAAICRMQIDLVKTNGAAFFPGQPLADVLDLHFVLLHLFLADAEKCQLSVSRLSRAMGLSRDAVRRKLTRLVESGWCTNGDHYELAPDRDVTGVVIRKAKIITETAKEVANLTMAEIAS